MRHKKNITSNLRNITPHFTGKEKIITLVLIIIMLSFVNITLCFPNIFSNSNVSALSYQSNVGLSFTFNPTLSVNISPSDLAISNLAPGTTSNSDTINVSVATNAAYGYTLSAIMNGNNSNLTHTNGTNVFSSIATDASIAGLTADNTWGYSYKNNLASTPTWSSYSGLSNSVNKVLFNTDSNSGGSIDFKIAAKASETQPSGTYTGIINFTATTKPMPKTIQDIAYMQTFAELDAVDLASVKSSMVLNNAYILKDIRDEKEYYVTRLEDGNVWMTQNLALDLSNTVALTSGTTDLNHINDPTIDDYPEYNTDYINDSGIIKWTPSTSTINSAAEWNGSSNNPRSLTSSGGYTDQTIGRHGLTGNYYNWSAAIASSNSKGLNADNINGENREATNSVCPKGWRLPQMRNYVSYDVGENDFANLNFYYNGGKTNTGAGLLAAPLYLVRSGQVRYTSIYSFGGSSYYWSSTVGSVTDAYRLNFAGSNVNPAINSTRSYGSSVRCIAR